MQKNLIIFTIFCLLLGWVVSNGQDKHQFVRLIDVLFYGPILIFLAFYPENMKNRIWVPYFLVFLGSTTISYNLRNYLYS